MHLPKSIGIELRVLSNMIRRKLENDTAACRHDGRGGHGKQDGLTGMQGWIIGYVSMRGNMAVFQRDLEKELNVRRPTMSGVLRLMERNGLIVREPVEYDARLKKLTLTPKAEKLHERIVRRLEAFEETLRSGLTDEEIREFFRILDKIKKNVE